LIDLAIYLFSSSKIGVEVSTTNDEAIHNGTTSGVDECGGSEGWIGGYAD
jgi:hypothetical protein